jgi:hypothetical protein
MTRKFDPATRNNDTGLYFTKTRRATVDVDHGELATWMQVSTAGLVVWENAYSGENGVISFEAGESKPIPHTKILSSGTVDGVLETTTAGGFFWMTTAASMDK